MSAFKSLTFFVSFLLILGVVCYGNRDYHQYLMGKEVKAIFPLVEEASIYFYHDCATQHSDSLAVVNLWLALRRKCI